MTFIVCVFFRLVQKFIHVIYITFCHYDTNIDLLIYALRQVLMAGGGGGRGECFIEETDFHNTDTVT